MRKQQYVQLLNFIKAVMQPLLIDEFFRRLSKNNPEPKTELNYVNAYTLLVAVVLSAQATDQSVNKATEKLFKKIRKPDEMIRLGEESLKEYVQSIGLYNTKAKNIIKLSEILVEKYSGNVPSTRAALEQLPGVGTKTASVLLNILFNQPTIAVDTHVFRVANRTGLARAKTPQEVEKKLEKIIPSVWKMHAHHWLILHGRYTCKARQPNCSGCLVYELCGYQEKKKISMAAKALGSKKNGGS